MTIFKIKLVQYVEEIAEIEVVAECMQDAILDVRDSIRHGTLEDDRDIDWSDGDGIHPDGIEVIDDE